MVYHDEQHADPGGAVRQEEAKQLILAKWRELPELERSTEAQAAAFAMRDLRHHAASCQFEFAGDKYQIIKSWLFRYLDLTAAGHD
jgi:hypothetical protein